MYFHFPELRLEGSASAGVHASISEGAVWLQRLRDRGNDRQADIFRQLRLEVKPTRQRDSQIIITAM